MKDKELPVNVEERIEIFNSCDYAKLLGIEIVEVWDGGARAVMDGNNKRNPFGTVHGAAIFALADHAFAMAANRQGVVQMALSAHIYYLTPANGRLEAIARCREENDTVSIYAIDVYEGRQKVAQFEGVAYKTPEKG